MQKSDGNSFEEWFNILKINVLERTGVEFRDRASVEIDFEEDRDVYDAIDEICADYGEDDSEE